MNFILSIYLMSGVVIDFHYRDVQYHPRLCDKAFDRLTYVGVSNLRNKTGIFYKSKEVALYSCSYEENKERKT